MPPADALAAGAAGGWGFAWLAALLLPLTIAASTLSALVERSGPIRLRHWAEEADGRLLRLYEQPARFEAFRLILSILAKLFPVGLFGAVALLVAARGIVASPAPAALWAVLAVLPVVVATEALNRVLVGWDPERALSRLTAVYRALLIALAPLLPMIVWMLPASGLRRRVEEEEDEVSEDEIEAFIDVGTREGILEPGEEALLRGIVDFGDTAVRSVMTPRIQVECAPVSTDLEELADRFVESGHSRIPLYDSSIDHIVGILHIRDVLRALRMPADGGERPTARQLSNPPFVVPETKPLGQLLKELQARRQQMAVVVDEYGGTAGVVTVEDLVEEIVGELVDEHEEADPANQLLPDGAWLLVGSSDVDVLEDLFGVDLGDDVPWETVGGMVFSLLGDVPKEGENVESHGLRYTVAEVDERRVARVRVEPVAPLTGAVPRSSPAPEGGA
jgi:CBS domain containing-hemolysin-like protein